MGRRPRPPGPEELLTAGAASLGLALNGDQIAAFSAYLQEILRWSARMSLTALREPEEIVREGFLDSLGCLLVIPPGPARALDIGSGAGFPALPLRLARPDLEFTLVEASRKKATFLRHAIRLLGLDGVRVRQCRAEELARDPAQQGAHDLVLARAVAPLPGQGRLAVPFLKERGLFLAQTGSGPAAGEALGQLAGLGLAVVREARLPPSLGLPGRRVLALRRVSRDALDPHPPGATLE
jgi:16S rRNA (guanine527-N7)-methyltransferase